MGFITKKRTFGIKLESTPYTSETLIAGDYNVPVYDVNYSVDITMKEREVANGTFGRPIQIAGKRPFTCSVMVDMYAEDTLDTPPSWGKMLQACGLQETVHAATGVSWVPNCEYSTTPHTIEIVDKSEGQSPAQTVYHARGCMGECKIVVNTVGEPIALQFEFTGVIETITDRAFGSILNPALSANDPDAVLASTLTAFGETQRFDTFTLAFNNDVQNWTDSSKAEGFEGARVVDRAPSLEADPDAELIAVQGDFVRWTGNTTGAMAITVGDITISAPAVQITKSYANGDREGHVTFSKSMVLTEGPAGNDEFEILQGAKS